MTASPLSAPIWNDLVEKVPLSNLLPPNDVVSAIRFSSSFSAVISSWIATRSDLEFEPFADCSDKSRIRCRMLVVSFIAPSAV
ncbi:Uncharacterised protein [Vibrio cholerae]|nr:Uncharacterised protein [Vibrio cholerae]CSA31485.1 Uncharacterised protein [Vibrio cholerae]CSA37276.1 Uncharacterised protein [Vibrio cholerae]CSB22724.1 Uncharacterised protein [Vibrio cholerae]CSB27933.1 Uncharacterised protein [Vibrio cholerae]